MTDTSTGDSTIAPETTTETTSFVDLGKQMWSFLTGKGAAISYELIDMVVEVPRETGPQAPRATWRLNGTLRITTAEDVSNR